MNLHPLPFIFGALLLSETLLLRGRIVVFLHASQMLTTLLRNERQVQTLERMGAAPHADMNGEM
eukprot:1951465-Amphidinium_carterae.1